MTRRQIQIILVVGALMLCVGIIGGVLGTVNILRLLTRPTQPSDPVSTNPAPTLVPTFTPTLDPSVATLRPLPTATATLVVARPSPTTTTATAATPAPTTSTTLTPAPTTPPPTTAPTTAPSPTTAAPTVTPTAVPPTNTPRAAQPPSTSTPRPAPTRTPTPAPPTATPTRKTYTSPTLLLPLNNEQISVCDGIGRCNMNFQWQFNQPLAADEWFDLRMWLENEPHLGVARTKDSRVTIDFFRKLPGRHYWTVIIVRVLSDGRTEELSAEQTIYDPETKHWIFWSVTK